MKISRTWMTIAAAALFTASLAYSAPHGCGAELKVGMARKLGLTDAQRQQVRDAQKSFRDGSQPLFQSLRAARQQFRDAKRAGDTAAMQSLKAVLASQRAELERRHDALDQHVASILTDQQRAQWRVIRAEREARRTLRGQ